MLKEGAGGRCTSPPPVLGGVGDGKVFYCAACVKRGRTRPHGRHREEPYKMVDQSHIPQRVTRTPLIDFPDVIIHATETAVKKHQSYKEAKSGDNEAALELV